MAKLSAKQQAFIQEYLVDLNATKAAIRAKYSPHTANEISAKLMKKPAVAAALQELMSTRLESIDITAERVLREIARIAFCDPRKIFNEDGSCRAACELDDDTAAAVAGIKIVTVMRENEAGIPEPETTKEIKLWD